MNCIYAFFMRYFWLPCECGRYYGGHEWFSENSVYDGAGGGHGVCPRCGENQTALRERSDLALKHDKRNYV